MQIRRVSALFRRYITSTLGGDPMRTGVFLRSAVVLLTTGTVGLGALAAPIFAQKANIKLTRKEGTVTQTSATQSTETAASDAIRPFHVKIPDEVLTDLRRRIAATKWPDRETVSDATQGVNLATMQKLAEYWQKNYDWRKAEARLNSYPQFITN